MNEVTELDVRALPPSERHAEVLRRFGALQPGESFVLLADHAPKPLLQQLQAEHPGGFEWSVLEAGPSRFRVAIQRRGDASSRNVSEYLEHDHRRLDAIAAEVEQLAGRGAWDESASRFAEFTCGLNRHIDVEEDVLFPVFEEATGMRSGPTAVMRREHIEIRQCFETVAAALNARNLADTRKAFSRLHAILSEHNMKEEGILYPMTDQAVGGVQERDELVRKLQAF